MGSIRDLLNPLPEMTPGRLGSIMPTSRAGTMSPPSSEPPRKTRAAKDGAVFRPGPIQGELRYPPHEERTPLLEEEHRKADLKPFGNIADYPRHIPYQSDKKTFYDKTGRDSFHVFQYTFQRKGVDTDPWTITWDYNIGLVRTTHLFKCLGYSKTTPGRVLSNNNGLREISHSITGGALAAQGYWMPYEAAKAIAATFCWDIRYLLTPLFGLDFPEMCIPPSDRGNFGRMVINPAIVEEAAETARRYRALERPIGQDQMSTTSFPPRPPRMEHYYPRQDSTWAHHMPSKIARHRYEDSASSARGSSSEPYCGSPQSPTHTGFLPVNRPPSSHPISRAPYDFINEAAERRKRIMKATAEGSDSETEFSTVSRSDVRTQSVFPVSFGSEHASADADSELDELDLTSSDESLCEDEGDEEYREPGRGRPSPNEDAGLKKNPSRSAKAKTGEKEPRPGQHAKEVKAAHALLTLHMQRASAKDADGDEIMEGLTFGPPLGLIGSSDKRKRRASL